MKTAHYDGPIQPLIKWAVNREAGVLPPDPFCSWVQKLLDRPVVEYWVGVITPYSQLDGDWVDRYPHTHINSVGWPAETPTAMTYLVAPDLGGEIGVGGVNEDDPYQFIKPTRGLTVIVDAATWHGVKPVLAGTRIALISSGFKNGGD